MFCESYARICGYVVIFSCFLATCDALQCHSCNVTASAKYHGDPCKGISSVVKCQDPAICLSTTYSISNPTTNLYQYATIKSCYPKMNGQECQTYLKNIRSLFHISTKVEYEEDCFICDTDNCNEKSSSMKLIPALLVSILCYLFVKTL